MSGNLTDQIREALAASYTIEHELGGGGMSRVFAATEHRLGRRVVIKLLPPELAAGVSTERFRREILVVANLRHPNIVPLYATGEAVGLLYYVMPFIEGDSLRQRLERGPLLLRDALTYACETADALEYAHRRGVIHRDIKPDNIMIESGHAVVTDFGIASAVEQAGGGGSLTLAGLIVGTPHYMSPEQATSESVDCRSDVYSLGCVLYEMVAGKPPFSGPTAISVITQHVGAGAAPRLPLRAPESAVGDVVARALAKAPADRFQTAAAFRDALAEAARLAPAAAATLVLPATQARVRTPAGGTRDTASFDSIAVLPFQNASTYVDSEYLSEGVTESIINKMANLPGVRVVPRATVFRYRDPALDPELVGAELQVRTVVTGRVQHRGNTLIISAELIDISAHAQLWGQRYVRQMEDVFAVQEEMATEISKSLRLRLSGDDLERLKERDTENPAAYQAYLKGRYHWSKRTAGAVQRATQHFQEAIDADPEFGAAHSGLADCYNVTGYYNLVAPREAYPRAKAAALRALELGDTVAEAHASLGFAAIFFDRRWDEAEAQLQRAIELKPDYAWAYCWYGWQQFVVERFDNALELMRRACELDPLSLVVNDHLAYALSLAGHRAQAMAQAQRTIELDPEYPLAYWRLGSFHFQAGRYADAVDAYRRTLELTAGQVGAGYLGLALSAAGRPDEAREVLASLDREAVSRFVSPLDRALIHAGLGHTDAVFDELELAEAARISDLSRVKLLPWPDATRADPRFAALVRRLGLPAGS